MDRLIARIVRSCAIPIGLFAIFMSNSCGGLDRDGARFITVWADDGRGNYDLYRILSGEQVFDENRSIVRTEYDEIEPDVSPSGDRVAFAANPRGQWDIFAITAKGSRESQITSDAASDGHPSWAPDGRRLAFHSNRDDGFEIYVIDIVSGERTRLTNDGWDNRNPDWSPDGKTIVFDSARGTNGIYAIDVETQVEVKLFQSESISSYDPDWSVDGDRLAFISESSGQADVYAMDLNGADLVRLTDSPEREADPVYTRNEGVDQVWFSRLDSAIDWDLFTVNDDGSDLERHSIDSRTNSVNERWGSTSHANEVR